MGVVNFAMIGAASVAVLFGIALKPKLDFLGLTTTLVDLNKETCTVLPDTASCEDGWAAYSQNLVYMACSDPEHRRGWNPCIGLMDKIPMERDDRNRLVLFNSRTKKTESVTIEGSSPGFWGIHGIAGWDDRISKTFTLFVISHRPQATPELTEKLGADSVIEMLEVSSVDRTRARWIKTIRHELIRTPNSLAVTGPRTFYVSNDHQKKVNRSKLDYVFPPPTDITYCDVTGDADCKIAVDGLAYPNGLDIGMGGTIVSGDSLTGQVTWWDVEADHTLIPKDSITLPHGIDNLKVAPNGEIYVAILAHIPRVLDVIRYQTGAAPTYILKLSRETSENLYYGQKFKTEKLLIDQTGSVVRAATTAIGLSGHTLVTGIGSENAVVCQVV